MLNGGDPDLLREFRDGAQHALGTVYRAYVGHVTGVVRAALRRYGAPGRGRAHPLGAASDVSDLIQEVFARAFEPRTRRRFDGVREYGPYIGRIARNVVADHLRHRRRQVAAERKR